MNRKSAPLSTKKMVSKTKARNKVISCSTPEYETDSPSRDSDSVCGSDAASPVPFLCTQDGADGETDVVWNYYTPKAEQTANSRIKNSTPLSRKTKRVPKKVIIEKPVQKKRQNRATQKNNKLFEDLVELNKNLHKFIEKKPQSSEEKSSLEEDLFSPSEYSPKSCLKSNSRCLRKNLLSSKFCKPESEMALESDDSMNECLIKASQIVEENIHNPIEKEIKIDFQDSMDGLLNNITLISPIVKKRKVQETPQLNNDSFDTLVSNLNDSALERLTQLPARNTPGRTRNLAENSEWTLQDLSSPLKGKFGRHSSMPESPSVSNICKPSTSGMVFGRYNSMPYNKNAEQDTGPNDSPIQCTPEEIRKKHRQARDRLLAKRQLPFTTTQTDFKGLMPGEQSESVSAPKKTCFQLRPATVPPLNKSVSHNNTEIDLKKIIEKKRLEALSKLRKKHR